MRNSYLALSLLLLSQGAFALPVVNENVANSGVLTIYPDHADPHRYYIAPNVVMIALDEKGVPYFNYTEVSRGFFKNPTAGMQMTLMASYTQEALEQAEKGILEKDPLAQFSGVPFIKSELALTGALSDLISQHSCTHMGGLIGQEQACAMILTETGRKFFKRALANSALFTTLQFEYSIQAAVRRADNSFEDQVFTYGIAGRIDGRQLAKFPQLIHRK